MIVFPNAKINLGLHVIARRGDGFHDIETVFFPVKLSDALEAVASQNPKTKLSVSGLAVPADGRDNLVLRAFELLRQEFHLPPLHFYLHKQIPTGAGLGGGSSDAAFCLKLVRDIFNLKLPSDNLHQLASGLGSDCAFFLKNKPALASGRGEILQDLPELKLDGWHLLLVVPPVHVPTAAAYQKIIPRIPEKSLKQLILAPVDQWKHSVINDFELTVFQNYPILPKIKQSLYELGAVYAAMSGSGSALFGLFREKPSENLAKIFPRCFIWQESISSSNF